ncbi:adenosylcobinamide-phosphate synthase CbiB [Leptospirillum ferriphilum]|jgi:adenosylcobinamide-phosphate synthase|uniref:adenosylcobinamide-phosphate synthase CbiB n=1 Tax=Leptospirillum ferriphilum TaxID=178606 RepID=UPI0009870274|nr:adenosylcobinamide-phosphate synthase CbiB [Leptospirillum ferriphilum]
MKLLIHPPFSVLFFLALAGDTFWGGRFYRFHPVVAMGRTGRWLERLILRTVSRPWLLRFWGMLLLFGVVLLFGAGSVLFLFVLDYWGQADLAALLTVFWGYQLLAGKSLEDHVEAVYSPLVAGDLSGARAALARIVGRDTEELDLSGIVRGAIESLSENANDALVAPLFFFALGGVGLLMGYKSVSTLDSQVGYKYPPYRDLGWASARADDLMAFLPARLSLLFLLAFFGFSAARRRGVSFGTICAEAFGSRLAHPSPNSAHTMSAFAALLGIRLGGGASYRKTWTPKPWIGTGREALFPDDLSDALRIFRRFRMVLLLLAGVWGAADLVFHLASGRG